MSSLRLTSVKFSDVLGSDRKLGQRRMACISFGNATQEPILSGPGDILEFVWITGIVRGIGAKELSSNRLRRLESP